MMRDIDPFPQGLEFMILCVLDGCGRRATEVGVTARRRCNDIVDMVVLKPETLVDGVESPVSWV
jgi:hypothetical protein